VSTGTRSFRREAALLLVGALLGGTIVACFMAGGPSDLVPGRTHDTDGAAVETAARDAGASTEAPIADEALAANRKEDEPQVAEEPRDPDDIEISKEVLGRARLYASGFDLHKVIDAELKAVIDAALDETKVEYGDACARHFQALQRSLGRAVDDGKGVPAQAANEPPRVATSPPRESDDGRVHALVPNRDGVVMEVDLALDSELALKDANAALTRLYKQRVQDVALAITRYEQKKSATKTAGQ